MILKESKDNLKRNFNDILGPTIYVLNFCGVWQPFNTSLILRAVYIAYSGFAMIAMITTGLCLIGSLLFSKDTIKENITDTSLLLFTLLNGWMKALTLLYKHKDIKSLLNVLLEDQCQPQDTIELDIQKKSDEEAKKITITYSTMVALAVIFMYVSILSKKDDERIEFLNTWRPYNMKSQMNFWITWIHEFGGHFLTASVHMAEDSLVPGLIIQLCCQLNFLQHRLNDFPHQIQNVRESFNSIEAKQELESYFISRTVVYHNTIFKLAEKIRNIFVEMLFIQFFSSLIVICCSVYNMSRESTSNIGSILTIYSYSFCMLFQLFLFCWYGNELMLNSINVQNAIFETNWLFLEKSTKESLMIMMTRCQKPILLSIGSVAFVNLGVFVSILKTSYSAYNVLKQSL